VTDSIRGAGAGVAPDRPTKRSLLCRIFLQEDLNFLVTNRIPRRYATLFMGWFSRIESPWLTRLSISTWRLFADDLRLHEATKTDFKSLQECFTRELRDGARPIDANPAVVVSPCDAVIGAFGEARGARAFQAKGFPYALLDLFGDPALAERHRNALFVTLRLKSNMYHRFHAPDDACIEQVRYLSGDTWNVNPIALQRVERLFCKNERVVLKLDLADPRESMSLVAVASILVASIRIHCMDRSFHLGYRGPDVVAGPGTKVARGEELGFFESGSTIILFVNGPFAFHENTKEGETIRVGQALFQRIDAPTHEVRNPDDRANRGNVIDLR